MGDSQATNGRDGPARSGRAFDPIAGMRAVADIQAEGLRAAGELLERVLGSEPDGGGARERPPADDYGALAAAWAEMFRRFAAAMTLPGQPDAITVAIDTAGVGPQVRLVLRGPDDIESGVTEIWLHNGTFGAVGPVALSCGQLCDSDGEVLGGAGVQFEPRQVPLLPARSSRAVVVSLVASRPLRAGTYRGTIQASGAPKLWLPFEVTIEPC
jgi:hypothetical protein